MLILYFRSSVHSFEIKDDVCKKLYITLDFSDGENMEEVVTLKELCLLDGTTQDTG